MEQEIVSFWRAFSFEASERAQDVLADIQIVLSRSLISGVPIILSEGQYRRVVIPYDLDNQVATIHYLVKDGRIPFLSVVMAVGPELTASMAVLLGDRGLSFGAPLLPKELDCFIYASGWRDLVTRKMDVMLVRASINLFPRTEPMSGGIASR